MSKHSKEKIDGIFTGFKIADYIKAKDLLIYVTNKLDSLGDDDLINEANNLSSNIQDKIEELWGRK
jgi:hypothetical protein